MSGWADDLTVAEVRAADVWPLIDRRWLIVTAPDLHVARAWLQRIGFTERHPRIVVCPYRADPLRGIGADDVAIVHLIRAHRGSEPEHGCESDEVLVHLRMLRARASSPIPELDVRMP